MTRGIQLKQLSAADLGHLGIPPDLLGDAAGLFGEQPLADDPFLLETDLDADGIDLLALTHEVRVGLEETLALLIAALPVEHRPPARAPRLHGAAVYAD